MTGEKVHRLLNTLSNLSLGAIIWIPTTEEVDEAAAELMSLIKRAEELDRRELGAKVKVHGISPNRVYACGNCDSTISGIFKIEYYKYCSHCGYRLIHPEPETYTVQINGKDVVLQKGVDYEVIPKKEIFYL